MFNRFTRTRMRAAVLAAGSALGLAVIAVSSPAVASGGGLAGGGSLSLNEGDAATALSSSISVTGSDTYFSGSIEIAAGSATSDDVLGVQTELAPTTTNGVVSISDGIVYVGDGTNALRIGQVDSVKNGGANNPLKITFHAPFLSNTNFNSNSLSGWTPIEQRIKLGTDSIAGIRTYDSREGTANLTNRTTPDQDDDGSFIGDATAPGADWDAVPQYNPNNLVHLTNPGNERLTLRLNMYADVTAQDTVFNGIGVYSEEFSGNVGDRLSFSYRNCDTSGGCNGSGSTGNPHYRMWAALVRTDGSADYTQRWTPVLTYEESAATTNWANASAVVPTDGTYRIVLVGGAAWDSSAGGQTRLAANEFRFDDFVMTPVISSSLVEKVARLVTYANTSDAPPSTRTVTYTLSDSSAVVDTEDVTVNITDDPSTPVVPPTPEPTPEPSPQPSTDTGEQTGGSTDSPDSAPPVEETEPTEPVTPTEKDAVSPVPSFGEVIANLFAPPSLNFDVAGAKANPALGATGNDADPPAPFNAMASPESVAAVSAQAALAAAMAAAVAGAAAAAGRQGGSESAGEESAGGEGGEGGGDLGGLDVGNDALTLNHTGWGDRLPIFAGGALAAFDRFSHRAAVRLAPVSPLLAKLITDGAYSRAMFGFLSFLLPLATAILAVIATVKSHGELAATGWILLVSIAVLGVLDAGAGMIGGLILVGGAMVYTGWPDINELRLMFGILLITIGPALIMTAFRPVRKLVASNFTGAWERITDLAVGPFMAGTTVATMVAVLPSVAGLTMSIANHVLGFGLIITGAAFLRVLLEEFVTRAFPARLNRINPSELPDPPMVQRVFKLLVAYGIWVLVTGAIIGPVWQSWIGSIFFLLPAVIGLFADRFPNVPFLWRILPQGVPGLAFGVVLSTVVALLLLSTLGATPESAAWIIVILPLPSLALGIMGMFGQHGHAGEVRLSQRSAWVFRIGGVVMFVVTLRLMGVI
ncbi:MAG: hypothetical protein RLZZ600_954 [Actinomycetota bacterium]